MTWKYGQTVETPKGIGAIVSIEHPTAIVKIGGINHSFDRAQLQYPSWQQQARKIQQEQQAREAEEKRQRLEAEQQEKAARAREQGRQLGLALDFFGIPHPELHENCFRQGNIQYSLTKAYAINELAPVPVISFAINVAAYLASGRTGYAEALSVECEQGSPHQFKYVVALLDKLDYLEDRVAGDWESVSRRNVIAQKPEPEIINLNEVFTGIAAGYIYYQCQNIAEELGCQGNFYDAYIYDDTALTIDVRQRYSVRVTLKGLGKPKVFEASDRDGGNVTILRDGRWIKHIDDLYKQVQTIRDEVRATEEAEEALYFKPIDDAYLFETQPRQIKPEPKPEPSTAEKLLELIQDIVYEVNQ